MNSLQTKQSIQQALHNFSNGNLKHNAWTLFAALGYESNKQLDLKPNTASGLIETFNLHGKLDPERALLADWQAVEILLQITRDEISQSSQLNLFTTDQVDDTIIESYLFMAIALKDGDYTRTQLARITREINKQFPMPVLILFKHGQALTLSVINRRLHKRDPSKDVLEKVTLIKDIQFARPHRAHLEILLDLSLSQLYHKFGFGNFVELHRAWQQTLDSSELNKRFFQDVANWYFWAVQKVTFPKAADPDPEVRNAASVIRLITRLIFVWFIKEKGLAPDDLFNKRQLDSLLKYGDPNDSTYYKAILQNLFFATLSQEMNTPAKPDNRKFRHRARKKGRRDQHYMIHNVYRYERYFKDPARALELFSTIPFLNGGLFECLDKPHPDNPKKILRIDGFSDRADNELVVPDDLFFSEEQQVDLNTVYGTRGKRYKVRGLINILESYKFTINENTPIEEEIALDPELLGKVFENLLAAYNPETETTARKQTGSFYTPREIVNYMVDESLMAYLETKLASPPKGKNASPPLGGIEGGPSLPDRLRHLLAYNEAPHQFSPVEVVQLVEAIDSAKILDPACGSGAFPMGILHKLAFILSKLDPGNERWKEKQIEKAVQIPDSTIREMVIEDIEAAFARNELDYGRKLYLIENCIYGVDIQPIAVQIAKLRFFISLVVDQKIDDKQSNRGVLPLPNLETKFVAANTLLDIDKPRMRTADGDYVQKSLFRTPEIERQEDKLRDVRHNYFSARTPNTKRKYRQQDRVLRDEIAALLKRDNVPEETVQKLAYWDPYDQNASADFFDPEWMFGVVGGFDVVIGNPPYVQIQKLKSADKKIISAQNYETYSRQGDIYCLFYEKSTNLLHYDGILVFITSNSWLRTLYGELLRKFFISRTNLLQLINFEDAQVFEAAIVETNILLVQKSFWKHDLKATSVRADFTDYQSLAEYVATKHILLSDLDSDSWVIGDQAIQNLKQKIEQNSVPLKDFDIAIYFGVKTGYNRAFIIDETTKDRLIASDNRNEDIIKPLLRGRDVQKYYFEFSDVWLVNTHNGLKRKEIKRIDAKHEYPKIYEYLEQYRMNLIKRQDQGEHWTNLRNCAYLDEFDNEKIIWGELSDKPKFALDVDGFYAEATLFFMTGESLRYLLAILNSKVSEWYFNQISTSSGMGTNRWKKYKIEQLPIKRISHMEQRPFENLVNQILTAHKANLAADTLDLKAEIDQLVYRLYGLTDEEIALVEEATSK